MSPPDLLCCLYLREASASMELLCEHEAGGRGNLPIMETKSKSKFAGIVLNREIASSANSRIRNDVIQ